MSTQPLDALPLSVLFMAFVLSLALGIEAGYRSGTWRHARQPGEKDQPVGAIVAAILGLVALVLGFTFSMAANRFEARRQAVLEEANTIGTTYLRARFLPPTQRAKVEALLREYVDNRLHGVQSGLKEGELERSQELQNQLWDQASEVTLAHPNDISIGLFVQTLNQMIDMHAKRVMVSTRSRIPFVLWLGLLSLSVVGMLAVGYQCGLSGATRSPVMLALAFSFALVLYLIADQDRGQEGMLRVGQQAMLDLQQSMQTP